MCGSKVHCRTGSLEMVTGGEFMQIERSLPYRQLRKFGVRLRSVRTSSLPYRQLRNNYWLELQQTKGSLPYRQLRNESLRITHGGSRSLPYRQLRKQTELAAA